MEQLREFIASEAGLAVQGLLVVAFADFVTGTFAALRDGTFAIDAVGAWIRKHIAGRVAPIGTLLVVGYFGGPAGQVFIAGALVAAAAYVTETAGSILGNINPPPASKAVEDKPAAAVNPVPTD